MGILKLYNKFHKGDIFYSRILTQQLIDDYQIEYYHNMNKNLFEDCAKIEEFDLNSLSEDIYNNKIINTWVGSQNGKFLTPNLCSFESYKNLYKSILCEYQEKIEVDDIELLPTIDYEILSNFDKVHNNLNIFKGFDRIIMICNGDVLSGQSKNFSFDHFLLKLCNSFKNYLFLVTNHTTITQENLINTKDLTEIGDDLLYISYISTKCDVIIGRASGPHCFTHVKENLLNPEKKFISFTNNHLEGIWFQDSRASQIWSNNFDENEVFNFILKNI